MIDDRLIKAIRNRQQIPSAYLDVNKFLELNNVGIYKNVCINRIYDRLSEWECEDTTFDIDNGFNLCLGVDSVKFCKDILCGYVSKDTVNAFIEYLSAENRLIEQYNIIAKVLKHSSKEDLTKAISNPPDILDTDSLLSNYIQLAQLELKCRSPLYMAYIGIKNKLVDICVNLKHKRKLRLLMNQ